MSVTFMYKQKWISVFVTIRSVFHNAVTHISSYICVCVLVTSVTITSNKYVLTFF